MLTETFKAAVGERMLNRATSYVNVWKGLTNMAAFNTITDQYNRLHVVSDECLPEVSDAFFTRFVKVSIDV